MTLQFCNTISTILHTRILRNTFWYVYSWGNHLCTMYRYANRLIIHLSWIILLYIYLFNITYCSFSILEFLAVFSCVFLLLLCHKFPPLLVGQVKKIWIWNWIWSDARSSQIIPGHRQFQADLRSSSVVPSRSLLAGWRYVFHCVSSARFSCICPPTPWKRQSNPGEWVEDSGQQRAAASWENTEQLRPQVK